MVNHQAPRVLRMKQLSQILGYAPSTIYDLVARKQFPAPFKLVPGGRASGWLESTVIDYLEERAAGRGRSA